MNTPQKFRKKPVEIEAMQYDGSRASFDALKEWGVPFGKCPQCNSTGEIEGEYGPRGCVCLNGLIFIETLEGVMSAFDDDWIIRGVEGEFYPVKDSIFQLTYEAVSP